MSSIDPNEAAMWTVEGYDAENLAPVRAGDMQFMPGDLVVVHEGHEIYPGEEGIVQAVGRGDATIYGGVLYDVLIEGTEDAWRFTEEEISEG